MIIFNKKSNMSCANGAGSKPLDRSEFQGNTLSTKDFTLTDGAKAKIIELCKREESLEKPFLRIMVEAGGCAGLKYHMILDDYISENDIIFTENDTNILVIDDYSMEYLKDGSLEYEETLESSGFKINNPNIQSSCSCGSSFNCSGEG